MLVAGVFKAGDLHLAHVDVSAGYLPCAAARLLYGIVYLPLCAGKMEAPSHLTEGKAEAGCLQLKMRRGHQLLMLFSWSGACCLGFVLAVSWWVSGKGLFCGNQGSSHVCLPFRISAAAGVGGQAWSQKAIFLPVS